MLDSLEEVEKNISIHAPLAGSDCGSALCTQYRPDISIHAPLAGSDEKITIR